MGAENLSCVKSIETHARAFLTLNILSICTVHILICNLHHKCLVKPQEHEIENASPERIPTNCVGIGEMFMMLPCQPRSDRYGMSPMH